MTPINDYLKKESSAQRWRKLTPLSVLSNLFVSIGGFGLLAYFCNYYIQNEDKKFEIIFQQVKEYKNGESTDIMVVHDQEQKDILCLTRNVYQCCGSKASANC